MSKIACNDLIRQKIDFEIQKRKQSLLDNYKELKNNTEKNNMYETILNDYNQYYEIIKKEKTNQLDQLNFILDYLENLKITSLDLEDKNYKIKQDQKVILEKINKIKQELQDITS
tara:strand:+ start:275 stop:619 length:345 start_codon:yes stop_codon:yes gene_type:complete